MKRTSINEFTINFAPVILKVKRTVYNELEDVWEITFDQYDYVDVKETIDCREYWTYDKVGNYWYKSRGEFQLKSTILGKLPKNVLDCIDERRIATEYALKYLKSLYEVEDEE